LKSEGGVSTPESYLHSILPEFKQVSVCQSEDNQMQVLINTMSTASFINIIDTDKTPISLEGNDKDELEHVDLCKFYCDGILEGRAKSRTEENVEAQLYNDNALPYDGYVIWRWKNLDSAVDPSFEYAIIKHSFNNFLSSDTTTTLPVNDLTYKSYVNSNIGTTVVWNVNGVGTMLWTYNPSYKKHERYYINAGTRDLFADRTDLTWNDIDIRNNDTGEVIKIVDNGKITYNIITNNPMQSELISNSLYNEYKYTKIASYGDDVNIVPTPIGNWQLVYPRINMFRLTNLDSGRSFTPTKLNCIKSRNLGNVEDIVDEEGYNLNEKSVIINESKNGMSVKLFNSETGTWESI
jgi:hypothetical protein